MISDLYSQVCSYQNLFLAHQRSRKGKTQKQYVLDFEKALISNLLALRMELLFHTYKPEPLQEFVIHDPKTRRINRSAFRDRVIHHALCNIIEPLFEKSFIPDSYANRKGKGAFKAIARYSYFLRKVSHNYSQPTYVLKADIRKYFETVSHDILLRIIQKKITDLKVLWLIRVILSNYYKDVEGIGMPLGNLTSQFFANVFLNELDQYVKHTLKVSYYVRYVDDFVVLDRSKKQLQICQQKIDEFLTNRLSLQLHPSKSKIILAKNGADFLGMRIFLHHKLLKKKNVAKFRRKYARLQKQYDNGIILYDQMYDFMEGWIAYAKNADTYNLRKEIATKFEEKFCHEISSKEVNRGRPKKPTKEVVTPPQHCQTISYLQYLNNSQNHSPFSILSISRLTSSSICRRISSSFGPRPSSNL